VQQTMEDVMLMPAALTMTATSRVPVYLDTPEMDSTVQVSHHTRDVQKVLQLVYKNELQTFKHSGIFQYSLLQHQCTLPLFCQAVYSLKNRFSLLSIKPCFNNSFKRFVVCKLVSMKMVF